MAKTGKLLVIAMFAAGAAGAADRPPLQQDIDHCTFRVQSQGRDTNLQGRVRLQLLIRATGKPYAAFVWAEHGISDRPLEICLSSRPMLWMLSRSTLDYAWPYPISFVPGGERVAGGAGSIGATTEQAAPSAFLPNLNEPPGAEPLNVAAAQVLAKEGIPRVEARRRVHPDHGPVAQQVRCSRAQLQGIVPSGKHEHRR